MIDCEADFKCSAGRGHDKSYVMRKAEMQG